MGAVGDISEHVFENTLASQCLTTMGQTSENVAEKFKISREEQDRMAVASNDKAVAAQKAGRFKAEIVPVTVKTTDKDGKEKQITVAQDDGPRAGTTLESLAKLPAAFKKGGSTTAGNSSQVSDGAAAVMLMKRSKAEELKLPVLGRFRSYAVAGVEPGIMGIGPAVAIPAALKKAGLKVSDIDVWELNEAFASQATYCVNKLGIDMQRVNPNGGAIALGHPLGMTGARQIATLLHEMKRTNKKLGVVSMCIGTGMGAAGVFEAD
jgi:acetyl-CoA acyltransferase 1